MQLTLCLCSLQLYLALLFPVCKLPQIQTDLAVLPFVSCFLSPGDHFPPLFSAQLFKEDPESRGPAILPSGAGRTHWTHLETNEQTLVGNLASVTVFAPVEISASISPSERNQVALPRDWLEVLWWFVPPPLKGLNLS